MLTSVLYILTHTERNSSWCCGLSGISTFYIVR